MTTEAQTAGGAERRAWRKPVARLVNRVRTRLGADEDDAEPRVSQRRVYVWDLLVRSTHWAIALSLVVLSVTGIYIGHPFLLAPGPAGARFVMGTMKIVHFYAAIVFTLAVLTRLVWMFAGSPHARWQNFVPVSKERRKAMWQTFLFYTFVRRRPPALVGHNPLAGATYVLVFFLYLVMIASGLGLYAIDSDSLMRVFEPLVWVFGGAQGARWWHHVVMWLLIGFTVHHVYSAVLMARVEKNGTVDSIVSGYKWVDDEEPRP
jgi:Ni/Fe-hydrogenase 1 B-type cytochrome subunit